MEQQHVEIARLASIKQQQLHADCVAQTAFHVYQHQPLIALVVAC
jgi:hypothetical protein